MIVAVALANEPALMLGLYEEGTFSCRVNVSSPSTVVSFVTAIFTVLLLFPETILAYCVVDLKSTSPPTAK